MKDPRSLCPICGAPIPLKAGMPAKTCSPKCRAERHRQMEKARYHRIKHTEEWVNYRAGYLERLRQRVADNPAFAATFKKRAAEIQARYKQRIDADPEKAMRYRLSKRQWWAEKGMLLRQRMLKSLSNDEARERRAKNVTATLRSRQKKKNS